MDIKNKWVSGYIKHGIIPKTYEGLLSVIHLLSKDELDNLAQTEQQAKAKLYNLRKFRERTMRREYDIEGAMSGTDLTATVSPALAFLVTVLVRKMPPNKALTRLEYWYDEAEGNNESYEAMQILMGSVLENLGALDASESSDAIIEYWYILSGGASHIEIPFVRLIIERVRKKDNGKPDQQIKSLFDWGMDLLDYYAKNILIDFFLELIPGVEDLYHQLTWLKLFRSFVEKYSFHYLKMLMKVIDLVKQIELDLEDINILLAGFPDESDELSQILLPQAIFCIMELEDPLDQIIELHVLFIGSLPTSSAREKILQTVETVIDKVSDDIKMLYVIFKTLVEAPNPVLYEQVETKLITKILALERDQNIRKDLARLCIHRTKIDSPEREIMRAVLLESASSE